jgi:hypothetical protein
MNSPRLRVFAVKRLFNDPEKVRDLRDDASHRGRIRARDLLIELRDSKARYDQLLILRVADRTSIVLDRDRAACVFFFLCHHSVSNFKFQISGSDERT